MLPELQKWVEREQATEPEMRAALWVYQGIRQPNQQLLQRCLNAADPTVRAAAVRVIADWHAELNDATAKLNVAISDDNAQVRLEAVNTLRAVGTAEAVEISTKALDKPVDPFIRFALYRTIHETSDRWLPAFESDQIDFDDDPQRIGLALTTIGSKAPPGVLADLIRRDQLSGRPVD